MKDFNLQSPVAGRGSSFNPKNRFASTDSRFDENQDGQNEALAEKPDTIFITDHAKSIITWNDSPDIPFEAGINPYRGCEHGCVYCYARQTHEYLGYSSGLDFESRILVKKDAAALLEKELSSPKWKPVPLVLSGITDVYQPAERRFELTRSILKVLARFRNPASIITKNFLITRDLDILKEMHAFQGISVAISLTTLDPALARVLEPRASSPARRLEAIKMLSDAGIPVMVMMAPIIPALNSREIPQVLKAAREAGARAGHYTVLRLPFANKELFEKWLEDHFPLRKDKVLSQIRELRGGELNDSAFHKRMRGQGPFADMIRKIFTLAREKNAFPNDMPALSTESFVNVGHGQLSMFSTLNE